VQPDGKLVVAGMTNGDITTLRYLPDGQLDTSFNATGLMPGAVSADLSFDSNSPQLAIQNDGKIVVAGRIMSSPEQSVILRYHPDGSLDDSFGDGGRVLFHLEQDPYQFLGALALQDDGRILVAVIGGEIFAETTKLVRFDRDGNLDASFGESGISRPELGGKFGVNALGFQSDGKILFAGYWAVPGRNSYPKMLIGRLHPDGGLDTQYGTGGYSTASFGATFDLGENLSIQHNDQVFVVGRSSYDAMMVAKFKSNGALDFTFGNDGLKAIEFGASTQYGNAAAVQDDGRIVVVGGSEGDFALARLLGNTSDLGIEQSYQATSGPGENEVEIALTVTNHGPDESGVVFVTDALPEGLQLDRAEAPSGSCEGTREILCQVGSLAANDKVTIRLFARADPHQELTLNNEARVASSQIIEPNSSNDTTTSSIHLLPVDPKNHFATPAGGSGCALGFGDPGVSPLLSYFFSGFVLAWGIWMIRKTFKD
jgi:conserved repeat domain